MKKVFLTFFFSFAVLSVFSQDLVTSFLEKYGKDDNLEVISIGKKMFGMMSDISIGDVELQDFICGLENIRVVTSRDNNLNQEYYASVQKMIKKNKKFQELVSVSKPDENMIVMIKENKGIVKELIFLAGQSNGFTLISMTGDIDMDTLTKYSEKLQQEKDTIN